STPAPRSTCQSNLALCPALGTPGSRNRSASGAHAGLVSGGRLVTGAGAASSPSAGRWLNGKYHASLELAASERPTSSPPRGAALLVLVSSDTSPAWRSRTTISGNAAGSSIIVTTAAGT